MPFIRGNGANKKVLYFENTLFNAPSDSSRFSPFFFIPPPLNSPSFTISRTTEVSLPLESNTESNRLSKRTHPCIPNQTCICVFLFQKYNPLNINLSRTKKLFPFTEIKITTSSSFDPILAICYKTPCTDRGGAVQLGAADEGGRVVTRKPSCVMALSSVRCFHPSNYPQIH